MTGSQEPLVCISYHFRDTRGPKGLKSDFWSHVKVLFFIQFRWDFFHWIPLIKSFQNLYSRFFSIIYRFQGTRAQKGKNTIFEATSNFYFSSNFDGIFFIGFLLKRAFRTLQPIFSISYHFRDTRGPKGQKSDFWSHVKVLFFIQFRWDFFHWIPLIKSFQKCCSQFFLSLVTAFEIQGA